MVKPYYVVTGTFLIILDSPLGPRVLNEDRLAEEINTLSKRLMSTIPDLNVCAVIDSAA